MAGALSDYMGVIYGVADGLRYALIIMCIFFVPAGIFMNRASRQITNDAEA
jgi:hypothetical protein